MTNTISKRLSLAALAGASSLFALAAPAQAQSVCTTTATGIDCAPTVATVTYNTVGTTVGGQLEGLRIVSTADQTVTGSGVIVTQDPSSAVVLSSLTDLNLLAGTTGALSATATGTGNAFVLTSGDALNATLGTATSASGFGVLATATNDASLTTGALSSGGTGALSLTSPAGDAAVTVNGNVDATGANTYGVTVAAPAGDASVIINGDVTATGTGAGAAGVVSSGLTSTVRVGNVTVAGGAGIGAAISSTATAGLSSVTCGNVSTTADGVDGVIAVGTDVVVRCGNITTTGLDADGLTAIATNSIDAQVGNVSTTGDLSDGLNLTAPGAITASSGTILTTGDGSNGVVVTGGTGPVTLATNNIATSGDGSLGILVTSAGPVTVNNSGRTIITTGAASHGVVVTTAGPVALNLGRISATGAAAQGILSTNTTGSQTINVAGVTSDFDAITAITTGTGAITINSSAPTVSTTGTAIVATGTTGAITVTETGATGRLGAVRVAAAGAAPVVVNVNGGTTATAGDAINVATLGTATVNIAAGVPVQGQGAFDAIDLTATVGSTINNRGSLFIDDTATGYVVRATGGAATINNQSGASFIGPVLLTANGDTVNNAGNFGFNGTSDFGLGTDVLNNQTGGNLLLDRGATVLGLETINNAGLANVAGTTTLTGTTFNNLAGGLVQATSGNATLAGITAFNNAGTISLADGATNDVLTLPGNYTGTGGARLRIDANPGLSAADRLVIGGNAGGSTVVDVNFVGNGPLFNPTGVLVVDAGGTGTANAFVIAPGDVQQGLLNYGIRQSGNDYFLTSNLDGSAAELSLLASAGPDMWYQSFDAYHDAIMGRQGNNAGEGKLGIWANLYMSRDKFGDETVTGTPFGQTVTYTQRAENHRRGAQGGLEYRGSMFTLGVTGGYEHNKPEFGPASELHIEGYNYGAYALFGMSNGIYGGVMVKRDDYDLEYRNSGRAFGFTSDAKSEGIDGELGLRFGTGFKFDLNAGLSYVKTDIDDYADYGLNFSYEDMESLRGRAGVRIIAEDYAGLFVGAKVFHEFRDNAYLLVANGGTEVGRVDGPGRGTWVRVEGGVGANGGAAPQLTVWGDLGDTKGLGARLGFHF